MHLSAIQDFFAMRSSKSDGAKDFLSKHPLFCLFPMHLLTNSSTQLQYYPWVKLGI